MSQQAVNLLAAIVSKRRRASWQLEKLGHVTQLALVRDRARYVVATTGRRWGKTTAAALKLLDTALSRPGVLCLYIAASRQMAKGLVWGALRSLNRDYDLGADENIAELTLTLANGSTIRLVGADTEREVNKLRGVSKLAIAIIDEAQRFRSGELRNMVDEVLRPALADLRGQLWLIGTPPPAMVGPFWDAWRSDKWSHHHATMLDNPYMSASAGVPIEQVMEDERARLGVTADAPIWRREWLGEWVEDTDSLVYRYATAVNDFAELPPRLTTFIVAADIGFRDADAIVALGWNEDDGIVHLVEEDITRGQTTTALGAKLRMFRDRYDPILMVADSGGVGLKTIETIKQDLDIPLQPAVKPPVVQQVTLVNDALRTARLKARATSAFAEDCRRVTWVDGVVGGKVDEAAYHSDVCPAVRYGWMAALPFLRGYEAPSAPAEAAEVLERRAAETRQRRARARKLGHRLDEDFETPIDEGDLWS